MNKQVHLLFSTPVKTVPTPCRISYLHPTQLYISFTLAVGDHQRLHFSSPLIVPLIKFDQIRLFLVMKENNVLIVK